MTFLVSSCTRALFPWECKSVIMGGLNVHNATLNCILMEKLCLFYTVVYINQLLMKHIPCLNREKTVREELRGDNLCKETDQSMLYLFHCILWKYKQKLNSSGILWKSRSVTARISCFSPTGFTWLVFNMPRKLLGSPNEGSLWW